MEASSQLHPNTDVRLVVDGYQVSKSLDGGHTYPAVRLNDGCHVHIITTGVNSEFPADLMYRNYLYSNQCSAEYVVHQVIKTGPILIYIPFGKPLSQVIPENGCSSDMNFVVDIACQALEGMCEIHSKSLLKGNISPFTLFWDGTRLKHADMGQATNYAEAANCYRFPTSCFAAPELVSADPNADARADQYSLGMTLIFVMCGAKGGLASFQGRSLIPSITHTALRNILRVMTSTNPSDRYFSETALLHDLRRCRDELTFTLSNLKRDSSSFVPSPQFKLFGRQKQVSALFRKLDIRSPQFHHLTFLTGIGKSSLLAVLRLNALKEGYVVGYAKFEDRGKIGDRVPPRASSALLQAFMELNFACSEACRATWPLTLKNLAGNSFLERMMPTGTKHSITEAFSQQTVIDGQVAFLRACVNATGKTAVLLLDDIQWSDHPTIALLSALEHAAISGLFVAVSFSDHPLLSTMTFRRLLSHSQVLKLQPLDTKAVIEWLTDLFGSSIDKIDELAEMIVNKTGGDPRLIRAFLDHLMTGSFDEHGWQFDVDQLAKVSIGTKTFDVELGHLSTSTLLFLQMCACIGTSFSLSAIDRIIDSVTGKIEIPFTTDLTMFAPLSGHSADSLISSALSSNMLIHFAQGLKFRHDSISHALTESIPSSDLAQLRLTLGCIFLDVDMPTAAEQFIAGAEAVNDAALAMEIARLCDAACCQAMPDAECDAKNYGYWAIWFLTKCREWPNYPEVFFSCHIHYAEALSVHGYYQEASDILESLNANDDLSDQQRLDLLHVEYNRDSLSGDMSMMVTRSEKALKLLGLSTECDSDAIYKLLESFFVADDLWNAAKWPVCTDERHAAEISWLMSYSIGCVFNPAGKGWRCAVLQAMHRVSQCKVLVEHLPLCVAFAAAVFGQVDIDLGKRMSKLASSLLEKMHSSQLMYQLTLHVLYMFVHLYHEPYVVLVKRFKQLSAMGVQGGAQQNTWKALSEFERVSCMVQAGVDMSVVLDQAKQIDVAMQGYANGVRQAFFQPSMLSVVLHLTGNTDDPHTLNSAEFNEDSFLQAYKDEQKAMLYFCHAKLCTLFWAGACRDPVLRQQALKWVDLFPAMLTKQRQPVISVTLFFAVMILLSDNQVDRARQLSQPLKQWAHDCPANYLHKYLLVQSEMCRIDGKLDEAWILVEHAVTTARRHALLQWEALANESLVNLACELCVDAVADDDEAILTSVDQMSQTHHVSYHLSQAARETYRRRAIELYIQCGFIIRLHMLDDQVQPERSSTPPLPQEVVPQVSSLLHSFVCSDVCPFGLRIADLSAMMSMLLELLEDGYVRPDRPIDTDWRQWLYERWPSVSLGLLSAMRITFENQTVKKIIGNPALLVKKLCTEPVNMTEIIDYLWGTVNKTQCFISKSIGVAEDDKTYWVYNWIPEAYSDTASVVYSVFIDISENTDAMKALERRLQEHTRELERSHQDRIDALRQSEQIQRMKLREAAKTEKIHIDFINTLCHQIRNPLHAIVASAELLSGDNSTLNDLRASVDHLRVIVDDVLDFTKFSKDLPPILEPFLPHRIVMRSISMFKPAATLKRIMIQESIGENVEDLVIRGDENRLLQVFANLMSNAVKFTPNDGKGVILVSMSVDTSKQMLTMSVRDNGIGMSESILKNMFTPYLTSRISADSAFGGLGLGIVISQRLVQRMGGEMTVTSVEGQFSEFVVSIRYETCGSEENRPSVSSEAQANLERLCATSMPQTARDSDGSVTAEVSSLQSRPKLRIMLVDDVLINRRVISSLLKAMGCDKANIKTAENGEEAVQKYIAFDGQFDLILMDIEMPVLDGYGATYKIREWEKGKSHSATIVALTGYVSDEHREKAIKSGMNDYLTKPVTKNTLRVLLESLVGSQ